MIPTLEGLLVDSCDPLFPALADFPTWEKIKRETGRNLNRTLCGTYLVITAEDDYPEYPEVLVAVANACGSVNAGSGVPEPILDLSVARGQGRVLSEVPDGQPAPEAEANQTDGRRKRVRRRDQG